ncbi:MAG: ribonuclease E/G, partial [Actinomycetota bacterium]
PHMVERVIRYKEKAPLMEQFGVEQEIKSTLSRRVDLPSGGYLIFDYAEAFTVSDVNTGRFVGSRGKNAGGRLEDTITKNNLEAVKEVVRQLRLRDIGGIIVIDFIDMANPKNRATVEEALRTELERDRTKTYVVEISPLGLVEMTRQNVTDGPREVMTRKCPTCGGDGIVYSEASAAIDVERRLRALATGSRSQAFKVELAAPIAAALTGPGARRLMELESLTKRRFFLAGRPDMHSDHFVVLGEGKLADVAPSGPVEEGAELQVELVEVDRHDAAAAVAHVDGVDVCVGEAAELVGKKVKVKIERVFEGVVYASLVRAGRKKAAEPLTAEGEAEKPTRKPPARKADEPAAEGVSEDVEAQEEEAETDEVEVEAAEASEAEAETDGAAMPTAKKKTRRGSRGGRNRKKKPAGATAGAAEAPEGADEPAEEVDAEEPEAEAPTPAAEPVRKTVTIHLPPDDLGEEADDEETAGPSENGDAPATPARKKTRRGSRGGKNRRKRTAAAAAAGENGAEPATDEGEPEPAETGPAEPHAAPEPEAEPEQPEAAEENWGYVPMSQWGDEFQE